MDRTEERLVARLVAGIDDLMGVHLAIGAKTPGVVPIEMFHAFRARVSKERKRVNQEVGAFAAHRREAELYSLLLLEVEQQLRVLVNTPGKGIVRATSGAGSPQSRTAAAMLGLRDLRQRLERTPPAAN